MVWAGWPEWNSSVPGDKPVSYQVRSQKTSFPTLFDLVLQEFCHVQPPAINHSDDVLFSVKQSGSDRFLTLFNHTGRNRSVSIALPALDPGTYNVYNLATREALSPWTTRKDSSDFEMNLQPFEIKVFEISRESICPAVDDFPLRVRRISPPGDALSGPALKDRLTITTGTSRPVYNSPIATTVYEVPSGTTIHLSTNAPGNYRVEMGVISGDVSISGSLEGSTDRIEIPGDPRHVSASVQSQPVMVCNSGATLRVDAADGRPVTLTWVRLLPVWRNVDHVWLSEPLKNPGTFPGKNFMVPFAPEKEIPSDAAVRPRPVFEGWKEAALKDGQLNISDVYPISDHLCYVAWDIDSDLAGPSLLSVGVDYGLRLWVNGIEIFNSIPATREGASSADEFKIPVSLRQGKNLMLAKVTPGSQGWAVWLRLLDQSGRREQRLWLPSAGSPN